MARPTISRAVDGGYWIVMTTCFVYINTIYDDGREDEAEAEKDRREKKKQERQQHATDNFAAFAIYIFLCAVHTTLND